MIRTNEFVIILETDDDRELLYRLLDGAASLWNQLTFARRQLFFDGQDIWAADQFYDEYKGLLGSATTETMARVNDRAWRAFFSKREDDSSAQPPGTGKTRRTDGSSGSFFGVRHIRSSGVSNLGSSSPSGERSSPSTG